MQREEQCPNCHKRISIARLSIHVPKCTSLSLMRSSRMSEHSSEISENGFHLTKSKIINMPPPSSYQKHQYQPDMRMRKCIFCDKTFYGNEIERHMANCEHRLISCQYCRDMFPQPLMRHHEEVCRGREQEGFRQSNEGWNEYEYQKRRMSPDYKRRNQEREGGSGVPELLEGIGKMGSKIFKKGLEYGGRAKDYCTKIINEKRQGAIEHLQRVQRRLVELLQAAIILYIEQAQIENGGMVSEQIDRLQRIAYHRKPNSSQSEPDICTICYCQLEQGDELTKLKCRHVYHPDCIEKWLKINSTCPVCKTDQRSFGLR